MQLCCSAGVTAAGDGAGVAAAGDDVGGAGVMDGARGFGIAAAGDGAGVTAAVGGAGDASGTARWSAFTRLYIEYAQQFMVSDGVCARWRELSRHTRTCTARCRHRQLGSSTVCHRTSGLPVVPLQPHGTSVPMAS